MIRIYNGWRFNSQGNKVEISNGDMKMTVECLSDVEDRDYPFLDSSMFSRINFHFTRRKEIFCTDLPAVEYDLADLIYSVQFREIDSDEYLQKFIDLAERYKDSKPVYSGPLSSPINNYISLQWKIDEWNHVISSLPEEDAELALKGMELERVKLAKYDVHGQVSQVYPFDVYMINSTVKVSYLHRIGLYVNRAPLQDIYMIPKSQKAFSFFWDKVIDDDIELLTGLKSPPQDVSDSNIATELNMAMISQSGNYSQMEYFADMENFFEALNRPGN
jgi:hypothetical protein